ncbi:tail fiber protein [Puniceicoccaceae bacterium K14]|nr:tail fiber protein [Puniceicoccaceae bacterium K14]
MSQPTEVTLGEIRIFAGPESKIPDPFVLCEGQLLEISRNKTLFSLLGTSYGGNGLTTFALPDMRGRLPVGKAASYPLGHSFGSETATVEHVDQIPPHSHRMNGSELVSNNPSPVGNAFGVIGSGAAFYSTFYSEPGGDMNPNAVTPSGSHHPEPHDNVQPFLCLNFIIALQGIVPVTSG